MLFMLLLMDSNYITYGTLFWYHIVSVGWVSANSVLMCSDHELRKLGNLTKDECELVRRWAAKSILASGFVPVAEAVYSLKEKWQHLSVGCSKLDGFLRGGVAVQGITEIAGESNSGKTQLCLQMALTVQYPAINGGLSGGWCFLLPFCQITMLLVQRCWSCV